METLCVDSVYVNSKAIMGNTESVVVQKRLARFRPEDRPVVEGVFDGLQASAGGPSRASGKTLTLKMLQVWLLKLIS